MNASNNDYASDKFTIDELLRRSWHFKNSKEFTKFFDFIARFDHYSRYNTMLVYIQNPEVRFFGGTSFWKKKFDRKVTENARPYIILAPKGPVMLVYDVSDTVGKESAEDFITKGLGRRPHEVQGTLKVGVFEHAMNEAAKWGIKVKFKPLSFFNGGYVTTIFKGYLEICLKQGMSNESNFAVLMHELAHLFLGHTGHKELRYANENKPFPLPHRKLSRTAEELEAETISYLICYKLGLQSQSAEYLAGYIKSEQDLLEFSYEAVIKTADKIEKWFVQK